MACSNLNEKANCSRLSRLLVNKGTEAMRNKFDNIHPPSTLAAALNCKAKKTQLQKLRYKVINDSQWNDLYPTSGKPESKNFDVTLLMILLRNICSLSKPASGWDSMPSDLDRSDEANILRIKLFRNQIYAHVTVTEVDDASFENVWQKISEALLDLGIPRLDLDQLKICPLTPEEETYVEQLKAWKRAEDECKESIDEIKSSTAECKDILHDVKGTLQNTQQISQQSNQTIEALLARLSQESSLKQAGDEEILLTLAKHNFNGNIRSLAKSFHRGSREWLFNRLEDWFAEDESRVMILTAGPGVGKSVFAGKVCEEYEKKGKLAACHFCKFNDSNLSNPQRMLESLASHMCANVEGFKDKLVEQLKRPHEIRSLQDAFRTYLNDPLQNLQTEERMLIIIDGLDESEIDGKSELLELIAEEFSKLLEWIKFLITSRPEIPVKEKLRHLNPFEILPEDEYNRADLRRYFDTHLPELSSNENFNQLLVKKCQGSFLFAFYVQSELNELLRLQDISAEVIERFLPQGIGSVYQKYFRRLESELKILNSQLDFRQFLEILISARGPLPLSFLSALVANGPSSIKQALRKVNESLSSLLVVCEDLVTVFHKSVVDWLTGNGYEEHAYAVDGKAGAKYLWQACEKEYEEIKERYPGVNLTNAMKYALHRGFSHLVDDGVACSVPNDCLWLVDPCIVHVISAVYPKTVDNLRASLKKCLEQSFSASINQRKILWHSLLLSRFLNEGVSPKYLQNLINDFPPEITSEQEISEAKWCLNESIWCEKLNSGREEHSTHFLGMTVLESNISCISISPNKKYCAAGREDGMITFLEFPNLEEISSYPTGLKSAVPCCTFSPDSSILLYGQLNCGFDVKTQEKSCFFTRCNHHFSGCSFSPSGTRLVTADGSKTLRLWDTKTHSLLGLFRAGSPMDSCTYSQSGSFIIGEEKVACDEFKKCNAYPVQIVGIWDTLTLQRVDRRHPTGSRAKRSVLDEGFNINKMYTLGTEVVLSSIKKGSRIPVEVYALPMCAPIFELNFLHVNSYSVIKSKPSTSLLRGDRHSWDVFDYFSQNVLARRLFSPIDYLLPSRNRFLTVACNEAALFQRESQLLAFETPSEQPKSQVHVVTCCFSPDGSRLASFTDDKMLSIWDVHKSRVIKKFRLFSKAVACWWSEEYFWRFHIINGKPLLTRFRVSPQLKIEASV